MAILAAVLAAQTGARYLIIAADSLEPAVRPLAEWHHASGIPTRTVRLSAIGRDTTAIKNYVRNAWNTWEPRPEFVLLVGSAESLPARLYYSGGSVTVSSDNIYGNVTGDVRAELAVGRLPAKSRLQTEEMVLKTLAYERTPDTINRIWNRRLTTVVHDRSDSDSLVYWADARHAAARARAAGFVACDSLASSRGDTADDIIASIDAGTSFVLYRGRATNNWYQPFRVLPQRTANGTRCPVVLSVTCETMTLSPGESMVGEAWIKTGTVSTIRGAVAFFGNTHSDVGVAAVRSAVARGFFDSLFVGRAWRLGHAARAARAAMLAQFPERVNDYLGFNLYGDPALGIWTAPPRQPAVLHPGSLPLGQQTATVSVTLGSAPVESALVCLSMDSTVYALGYTDFAGAVRLPMNPRNLGLARLVVTGRNLYPYDTVIPVVMAAVAESPRLSPAGLTITAVPAAFTGQTCLRLSAPLSHDAWVRVFDALGREVACLPLRPGATALAWDGRDSRGARLAAGVYSCRIAGPAVPSAAARILRLH